MSVLENDKVSVMRELEHYAREKNQKLGEGQQQDRCAGHLDTHMLRWWQANEDCVMLD